MSKPALVIGEESIGDELSTTLPLVRALKDAGNVVHLLSLNLNNYRLMRVVPEVDVCLLLGNFLSGQSTDNDTMVEVVGDVAKLYPGYSAVYTCESYIHSYLQKYVDLALLANLVKPAETSSDCFRSVHQLSKIGLTFKEEYLRLHIDLFQSHKTNFKCSPLSVLWSHKSNAELRNYSRHEEVTALLTDAGFEVHTLDLKRDIRTNMHLLQQVRYVLTTDTGALWMSRALGKEPYVFLSEGRGRYDKNWIEKYYATNNILGRWAADLDEVAPAEICSAFIKAVESRRGV